MGTQVWKNWDGRGIGMGSGFWVLGMSMGYGYELWTLIPKGFMVSRIWNYEFWVGMGGLYCRDDPRILPSGLNASTMSWFVLLGVPFTG